MNSNRPAPPLSQYLKTLSFLHMVMSATPLIMGFLFYLQAEWGSLALSPPREWLGYLVPALALGSVWSGSLLFRGMIGKLSVDGELGAKLARYQSASLLRFALIEGAALFAMVIFANSGNLLYALIGALLILHLILLKPNLEKIGRQLPLGAAERSQLGKMERPRA